MKTTKGTIIITYDNIVDYTSYNLYSYLCKNVAKYFKYLDILKLKTMNDIYERTEKNVLDTFLRKFNTPKMTLDSATNLMYMLMNDYYGNSNNLTIGNITPIMQKAILNPFFVANSGIDNIVFLIKYHTDLELKMKTKLLESLFKNNSKLKIIPVKLSEKYIDKINFKWDIVITDDIDFVEKLAARKLDHNEFLVPQYGYDVAKPELLELIKYKDSTLSYYPVFNRNNEL